MKKVQGSVQGIKIDRYQEAFVRLRCMELVLKNRSDNKEHEFTRTLDDAAEHLYQWAMQEKTDG